MGHRTVLWILSAAVASLSFSLQAAERDVYRLQGLWRNKAAWDNPRVAFSDPVTFAPHSTLQIMGEELRVHMPLYGGARVPFRLFPAVHPKQFELSEGFRGIYEIADDMLRVCFTRDGKAPPAEFKMDWNNGTILIEYERLSPEYAKLLAQFQGEWTLGTTRLGAGSVSVGGECIYQETKMMFRLVTFRLNPAKQPPELKLKSILSPGPAILGNYSLVNGRSEMRFPLKKGVSNPFMPNYRPKRNGNEWLILRRNLRKSSVFSETLTERRFPLAERKTHLQQTIVQLRGTLAADHAAEELARMPTDKEIREIDAEFALTTSERDPPSQRKQSLQAIIAQYGETKAAAEARQMLAGMPSDAEIREAEAETLLDSAKEIMKRKPTSARKLLNAAIQRSSGGKAAAEATRLIADLNEREAAGKLRLAKSLLDTNSTAAHRRFREIVKDYPDTRAAAEAQHLLD